MGIRGNSRKLPPLPKQAQARVMSIKGEGERRFIVTSVVDKTLLARLNNSTVTVTLTNWTGNTRPVPGEIITVIDLVEFAKGWRARSAQPNT